MNNTIILFSIIMITIFTKLRYDYGGGMDIHTLYSVRGRYFLPI